MRSDGDYRENQLRASADWRARNPDYRKLYRKNHPVCIARNREQQKKRISHRRAAAKMDVCPLDSYLQSGLQLPWSLMEVMKFLPSTLRRSKVAGAA